MVLGGVPLKLGLGTPTFIGTPRGEYKRVNLKYELPILAPVPVIDPATGLQRIDPATQQPVFKIPTVTYANHGRYCSLLNVR